MFRNPRRTRAGVRRPGAAGFSQGRRRSSVRRRARRSWVWQAMTSQVQRSAAWGVRSLGAGPAQGLIEQPEGMLDGLIASDKFCWTRHGQLRLDWWRRPLRKREPAGIPLRGRRWQRGGAAMRRTFEVRRETSEQPDGQARWDRAYQLVLVGRRRRRQQLRKEPPMRAALYVRVSTDRQQHAQTIEQQVTQLRAWVAARDGWTVREEHIFRDDGRSGARLDRPGLDALRDHAARAAFDVVVVCAPDRLARKFVHQMVVLEELQRRGVPVVFIDRPLTDDPHEQLVTQIRGAVAEYERTLIADRMRRGRQARLRSGQLLP